MDAITMLKNDHRDVEKLFRRFEKAGDGAHAEKRDVVDRIIEALSVHAAVEELVFYPVIRATVPDVESDTLEAIEEHHVAKVLLAELEGMSPEDERFDAKVTVLIENVRHHVEEEESDLFPMVRDELGRNALAEIGEAQERVQDIAPTHPHPNAPDAPPGNLLTAPVAGVADRIGDTVSGLAEGTVLAVGDLIATVLRRKKPRRAPTGSSTARRTSRQVRGTAADVTQEAIDAARAAQDAAEAAGSAAVEGARQTAEAAEQGARSTARAARSGAKRTGTTARKAAARTSGSAKRAAKKATTTKASSRKATSKRASTKKAAGKKASARKASSSS